MKFLGLIVTTVALSAQAAELRSSKALSHQKTATAFTAELKAGFHFNEKAPNAIVDEGLTIKPKSLTASKISFEYTTEPKAATAKLYVCDDAVTFCETHSIPLQADAKKVAAVEKSVTGKVDENGFIQDDLGGAIEKARAQKKLVLIDFSARWCPSCKKLDREVFSTKSFAKFKKDFVFVKLDTDRFQNAVLAEKFKIVGIPTTVFINPDQQVLAQILDYQPLSRFNDLIQAVVKDPKPYTAGLENLSKAKEEEKLALGYRFFYAGQYADANKAWETMVTAPKELLSSQYWEAADKFDKESVSEKDFSALLKNLLAKENQSGRSIQWRKSLLELKSVSADEKKKYFAEGLALADQILAKPETAKASVEGELTGDLTGHEDYIVACYRGDLVEANKSTDPEIEAAWKKAMEVGEKSNFKANDVGPALRFLGSFTGAKEWKKGLAWIQKLKKANPENEDLLRRETRYLVELKDFKQAVKVGEEALKKSYDRNHFWVVEYLAKAYQGNGQTEKAKTLLSAYLAKPEIEVKSLGSTKKALVKLQEEYKTL